MQARKIQVTAIHHAVAASMQGQFVQRGDFVPFQIVQTRENRNVAAQIEQHIELYGSQGFLPASLRKHGHAQLDYRGIQRKQVRFQTEFRCGVRIVPLRPSHQGAGDGSEDTPVAIIVGVRQIGPSHPNANTHVIRKCRTRAQAGLDSPQTPPVGQLGKNHRRQMIVKLKFLGRARDRKLSSSAYNFVGIQACHDLSEDRRGIFHLRTGTTRNCRFWSSSKTPLFLRYSMDLGTMQISNRS